MPAVFRGLLALLVLAVAGCNLSAVPATTPPPATDAVTSTPARNMPTHAPATEAATATPARSIPTLAPAATATIVQAAKPVVRYEQIVSDFAMADSSDFDVALASSLAAGEFRLTYRGDKSQTFESTGTQADAALLDRGATALLRFELGDDSGGPFAEAFAITLPAGIQPGDVLLQENVALDTLTGDASDAGIAMTGYVSIDTISARGVSGSFRFTAQTNTPTPTVVTGRFYQIPRMQG